MSGNGHNSAARDDTFDVSDGQLAAANMAADEQLRLFIERIERLEEEKKATADDIKDTYGEAKSNGYDPKIMKAIVRLRKMQPDARKEMEALIETYKAAVGLD